MVFAQFCKTLQVHYFLEGGPKNFKLLVDISFESSLQKIVLPSLLLFLCACYYCVRLDDIQWNELATSTARNFNNSWPLYLNFRIILKLSPNLLIHQKFQMPAIFLFFFEKRAAKKAQIFHIFKGLLFRNGWPYWYEFWRILRDSCELSKKCGFATFPEI